MKKKVSLTSKERELIILENFTKVFNKIKRIDESNISELEVKPTDNTQTNGNHLQGVGQQLKKEIEAAGFKFQSAQVQPEQYNALAKEAVANIKANPEAQMAFGLMQMRDGKAYSLIVFGSPSLQKYLKNWEGQTGDSGNVTKGHASNDGTLYTLQIMLEDYGDKLF